MLNEVKTWAILIVLAAALFVGVSLVLGSYQCVSGIPGCVNKAGSLRL